MPASVLMRTTNHGKAVAGWAFLARDLRHLPARATVNLPVMALKTRLYHEFWGDTWPERGAKIGLKSTTEHIACRKPWALESASGPHRGGAGLKSKSILYRLEEKSPPPRDALLLAPPAQHRAGRFVRWASVNDLPFPRRRAELFHPDGCN